MAAAYTHEKTRHPRSKSPDAENDAGFYVREAMLKPKKPSKNHFQHHLKTI
jgi:hypothetical protein